MHCFYHNDRPTVAQCKECGKFLCRECASKYNVVICDDCAQARIAYQDELEQRERTEIMVDKRRPYKLWFWWTIVIFFGRGLDAFIGYQEFQNMPIYMRILHVATEAILFGAGGFGWHYSKKILNFINRKLDVIWILSIATYIIGFAARFLLSIPLGWVMILYKLVTGKLTKLE